jgi:four helix bundle protein
MGGEGVSAKGQDIEERLLDFGVRIISLCDHLPRTTAGRHVGSQVVRSGTAPAAHYAEARSAESRRDFIHKLRLCLKELNETRIWLILVVRSDMLPASQLEPLQQENNELCRIISRSIKTAQSRINQ